MSPEEKLSMDLMLYERESMPTKDPRVPIWTEHSSGQAVPKTEPLLQKKLETDQEAKKTYSDILKKYDAIKSVPPIYNNPKMEEAKKEYMKALEESLIKSGIFQVG